MADEFIIHFILEAVEMIVQQEVELTTQQSSLTYLGCMFFCYRISHDSQHQALSGHQQGNLSCVKQVHNPLQCDGRKDNMLGKVSDLCWSRRGTVGSAPTALISRATHSYWMSLYPGFPAMSRETLFWGAWTLQSNSKKKGGFFFLAFLNFPFFEIL